MNHLKKLLKQPIKYTLVLLIIILAAMAILSLINMFLGNFLSRDYVLGNDPGYLVPVLRRLVADFILISRIISELAFLLLVAQIVYRFSKK